MRIHSLRVENFRGLVAPVEFAEIDAELTVIAGDNEQGKSTLLEAIRTVLFDRYKLTGKEAEALQPLGHAVGPEVTLGFSIDGTPYSLHKRFCQKPTAGLTTPSGVLRDDAAEDALQALLGFSRPGRGASKPEHQGVWGMLWIQQGQMFQGVAPEHGARGTLQQALEAEVGDVLGGAEGRDLLARIEQAYRRFWTARSQKASGAFRDAGKALDELRSRESELVSELERYDEQVDQLDDIERKLDDYRRDDTIGVLEGERLAREREAQAVAALEHEVERARDAARLAGAEARNAEDAWQRRVDAREEVERLTRSVAAWSREYADRQSEHQQYETALGQAREAAAQAEAEHREARTWLDRLQRAERRHAGEARLAQLRGHLEKARDAAKAHAAARHAARRIAVTPETLQALSEHRRRVEQLEATLQAGATRVSLDVNVPVTASGDSRATDTGYLVTGEAAFALDGVGEIAVSAGTSGLDAVERELADAQDALADALRRAGAESVTDAERLARERQAQENEAIAQERVLKAHAPDDLDALEAEVRRLEDARPESEDSDVVPEDAEDLAAAIRTAETQCRRCAETVDSTNRALETARTAESAARNRLTEVATTHRAEDNARAREEQALQDARERMDDDALYRARLEAQAHESHALAQHEDKRKALATAEPEMVRTRLRRATQAVQEAERDLAGLNHKATGLRAALQAQGHRGLGEELETVRAQRIDAERRHAALSREANALRVAFNALSEADAEARQTFLEPVRERVRPYLRRLFADAELVLDDNLGLTGLMRGEHVEPFTALSIGTREQLAIITRLAFADLLAEQGQDVPIFLDDALVYADDERFATMRDVITRAAERHQVIVLTCHEAAYRGLGGRFLRMGRGSTT